MKVSVRIGAWALSFVLADIVFTAFLLLTSLDPEALWPVFRTTLLAALPVWCLYLPLVWKVKDAEGWHWTILLLGGVLLGPLFVAGVAAIQIARGASFQSVWEGDLGLGVIFQTICAVIVGGLTSTLYVFVLRVAHRRLAS